MLHEYSFWAQEEVIESGTVGQKQKGKEKVNHL
jgi:hypothetical protein